MPCFEFGRGGGGGRGVAKGYSGTGKKMCLMVGWVGCGVEWDLRVSECQVGLGFRRKGWMHRIDGWMDEGMLIGDFGFGIWDLGLGEKDY